MLRERYHPIIKGIRELPKPVVAAVNGPAVGIGCSLALACDLIWAAESAIFGLAFVNIGLVPDGGSTFLVPVAAGKARALEMALLGDPVPAQQALEWGLINRVVPDGDLMEEARALAGRLAQGPDPLLRAVQAGAQQLLPQDHGRAARPGGRHPGRDGHQRATSSRASRPSSRSGTLVSPVTSGSRAAPGSGRLPGHIESRADARSSQAPGRRAVALLLAAVRGRCWRSPRHAWADAAHPRGGPDPERRRTSTRSTRSCSTSAWP